MRVFDGNQLYTNLNQIDFKNKIAKRRFLRINQNKFKKKLHL